MLLLVVEAKLDQRGQLLNLRGIGLLQKGEHGIVDVFAVDVYLGHGGPRDQATVEPVVLRANGVVVGVEEVLVAFLDGLVAAEVGLEDECFEERRTR